MYNNYTLILTFIINKIDLLFLKAHRATFRKSTDHPFGSRRITKTSMKNITSKFDSLGYHRTMKE